MPLSSRLAWAALCLALLPHPVMSVPAAPSSFVAVPAGTFPAVTGSEERVTISAPFSIGRTPVTQAEFVELMGFNPSKHHGDPRRPVENVTWIEATVFAELFTRREREAGRLPSGLVYRLPTSAEWEYAARAGTEGDFFFEGNDTAEALGRFAWFRENAAETTHPVEEKEPNGWGLFDMYGNVAEWCLDAVTRHEPGTDPVGRTDLPARSARGGSYASWGFAFSIGSTAQIEKSIVGRSSDVGFRLVLAAPINAEHPVPPRFRMATIPGATISDLNDLGDLAGRAVHPDGGTRAVLLERSGEGYSWHWLADPAWEEGSRAVAINNRGVVAIQRGEEIWRWSREEGLRLLGRGSAVAINERGSIAAMSPVQLSENFAPHLPGHWDADGIFHYLYQSDLTGGGSVTGISDDDEVVGYWWESMGRPCRFIRVAFRGSRKFAPPRYEPSWDCGYPAFCSYTVPHAINGRGDLVWTSSHPCLGDTTAIDGDGGTGPALRASALNNAGEALVGLSYARHVLDSGTYPLEAAVVNLNGHRLTAAPRISNEGIILVEAEDPEATRVSAILIPLQGEFQLYRSRVMAAEVDEGDLLRQYAQGNGANEGPAGVFVTVAPGPGGDGATVEFSRRIDAPDLVYLLERSADLRHWEAVEAGEAVERFLDVSAGRETVRARQAEAGSAAFYRLRLVIRENGSVLGEADSPPRVLWLSPPEMAEASGELRVHATGEEPLSYVWFKDGVEIRPEDGNPILRLHEMPRSFGGEYRVAVRNAHGTHLSWPVIVDASPPPTH